MLNGRGLHGQIRTLNAKLHATRQPVKQENCQSRFHNALSESSKYEVVEKIQSLKFNKNVKLKKKAAVLVSLCRVEGLPSLLYTVRSQDLRNHSGQVSFPGGQCDWTDRDVIHTALREAEEEIGIPQSYIDIWAVMPPLLDRFKTTLIYPVVGNIGNISKDQLVPNQTEVSKIFTVPLEILCSSSIRAFTTFRSNDAASLPVYTLPVYLTRPRIWGLTAIATELFLSIMFPDIVGEKYAAS